MNNISIEDFSLSIDSKILLSNTKLKIAYGQKYGLIGINGVGKSTLMKYLYEKKIEIPKGIDIFYVDQEFTYDETKTIYQIVLEANRKKIKLVQRYDELEKQLEKQVEDNTNNSNENILEEFTQVSDKLNALDVNKDDAIVRKILFGLGFNKEQQDMEFRTYSGGYKMRISLARGLYMKPDLLLLDEVNNHLDLESIIWLTDYLANKWKKTLVVISHDKNFLNQICNEIIYFNNKKLYYYKGNYDSFKKAFKNDIRSLEKEWRIVQKKVHEMQSHSVPKQQVDKFLSDNKEKQPPKEYVINIKFQKTRQIKWPCLSLDNISFGYNNNNNALIENVNLSFNQGEKIAIVGINGCGKTTLMKVIVKELLPTKGEVIYHPNIRIGYYTQHLTEKLPINLTPIEFLQSIDTNLQEFNCRKYLGSIGLVGDLHKQSIGTLSGGQKARVLFASICAKNPHVILLDEPTNHLDIETIDALVNAINEFDGAIIMITHNINLIEATNCKIYELYDKTLNKIEFNDYFSKILDK